MKISVFGLGFVGLTTAVGFASKWLNKNNIKVCGYEIISKKAEMLKNGKIPFFEKGLEAELKKTINKNLKITNDIIEALNNAKIIFYCIGTPMGDDGSADLRFLLDALKNTAGNINKCEKKPILVIKSTIPPSSCNEIFLPFLENLGLKNNVDFVLASNPEFLREGSAFDDFINPDRIVIGSHEEINELKEIYAPFKTKIIFVNPNTAEFIKYLSNTTLSMMISYANEMSIIAKNIGEIDIKKAFEVLHLDNRFFGNPSNIINYIYPGMGFGGYCLPKDTLALYKKSKDKGYTSKLIQEILEINNNIIDFHINEIKKSQENKNIKIAILGLSFKPNSDDVRDSKSLILIQKLQENGYKNINAYDPIAIEIFKNTYDLKINYIDNLALILDSCDIFIIATAWEEFKKIQDKIPHKKIYNLRYL